MWASMSDGGDVAADCFTPLEKGTQSLSAGFKKLSASSKAFLGISAGIIAITVAMKAFEALDDKFTLTFETAQKHLEESTAAYSETKSELESLKSQTDEYKSTLESIGSKYDIEFTGSETVDEMIDKLQSIDGGVDIADEASIKKLERQNELLKTQESILSARATTQQKQAAEDARTSIDFASEEIIVKDEQGNLSAYSGGGVQKTTVNRKKYVQEQIKEMERAQAEIEEAQAKIASDDTSEKWAKQFENATADLEEYKNNASSMLSELNAEAENFYDAETGLVLSGFEEDAKAIKSLNDAFNDFDLSPAEKQLKSIENFFDGSSGKNFLKDYLLDAVKSEEKASEAIRRLGIDLNDVGIDAKTLDRYFEDMAESANEAADAINSVDGSVAGVKGAGESADQDANWTAMAEARTKAVEAYNKGRVGTDDFQTFVQFMTNKTIDADAGFKYDADAYVQYWKEANSKAKRYFDENNPLNSVKNFANDLVSNDLATKIGNEYTWAFDNTAQAADALGISVDAVETLMHGLEAYGAEFDDVMFSGEGLDNYESKLEGIKSLYDSMGEGSDKKRLGRLIDGWDENIEKYEADLNSLTQDQIIHLEFEYDLATIRAQIDELKEQQRAQGGKDATTNASIIAANEDVLATQREGLGLNTGEYEFEVRFKPAQDSLENLYNELKSAEYGSDEYFEIQAKIQNAQELESSIYDLFSEQHPEINAESNPKEIEAAWDDFFSKPYHFKVEGKIDKDSVESQLEGLSSGSTIEFTAKVGDAEETISAIKDQDGNITYQANINGALTTLAPIEHRDGSITYEPITTSVDSHNYDQTGDVTYTGIFPKSAPTITGFVNYIGNWLSGKGPANGTAHSVGTALWQNYRRETRQAYAGGHWGLRNNANGAMINELGEEIIVRDGQWFTVNNGYPSLTNLKKGDIIFNHKQTEQIKKHGYVTGSHAKLAYAGGSAFANGWQLGGGAVTGGGSGKSSENNDNNSPADSAEETFDKIEILLNRMQRTFDNLSDSIETYSHNLTEQNAVTDEAMSMAKDNLETLKQASARYLQEANNVNLDESWKEAVKNGAVDITKINDEDLKKNIDEFKTYYEKHLDVEDKILDTQKELLNLAVEKLENIDKYFENRFNYNDNFGYSTQISEFKDVVNQLRTELQNQVNNGIITQYSNEWYEAMETIAEREKDLLEATWKKYEDVINYLSRVGDTLSDSLELKEAKGELLTEDDYRSQIENNNKLIKEYYDSILAYEKRIAVLDVGTSEYGDLADKIADAKSEIFDLATTNEELEDSIWDVRFTTPFEELINNIDDTIESTDNLRDLLNEDAFFDKEGVVTEDGLAAISLLNQSLNESKQKVAEYTEGLKILDEAYTNGTISETKYKEAQSEMIKGIQDSVADVKSYKDELLDLYKQQMEHEADYLNDIIDKYAEAKNKKAAYYDYDKQVRNQTKSINALKSEIAALEGVNNAQSAAELKRKRAELAELEEELAETKRDHSLDMQKEGYDSFKNDISSALEDTEYAITHSTEKQEEVISSMLDRMVNKYAEAYGKINQIIYDTGFVGNQSSTQNIVNSGTATGSQSQADKGVVHQAQVGANITANTGSVNANSGNDSIVEHISKEEDINNRKIAELTVSKSSVTLEEGKSETIKASIRPTDAKNKTLSWGSSNTSVATVSGGVIKALKPGSCQIVVSTTDGSGLSQTIGVTVTKKPEPVVTNPTASSSGGDGNPRVGDVVTLKSGERYYHDSYGKSPAGNLFAGVPGGVVIDAYSSSKYGGSTKNHGDYAVHIKSADGRYDDLGWVKLSQLSGYASGAKLINKDEWAIVNENGEELILNPEDGIQTSRGLLKPIKSGTTIIDAQGTQNLYELAKYSPADIFGANKTLSLIESRNSGVGTTIENHYDSLLTVNGNVDRDALPGLQELLEKSYRYSIDKMYKEANKLGFKRTR